MTMFPLLLETDKHGERFGDGYMLGVAIGIMMKRYGEAVTRETIEASINSCLAENTENLQ